MENRIDSRIMEAVSTGARYCGAVEQAAEYSPRKFVDEMLGVLPRIYLDFCDPELDLGDNDEYFSPYVDEDYYDSIRRRLEMLFGEHDVFLETFEDDMKYSETPVAASIAESLADIYQALYNFISVVRDTEGESLRGAYLECRENFASYWSQTLCNVLRALNYLRYNVELEEDEEGEV